MYIITWGISVSNLAGNERRQETFFNSAWWQTAKQFSQFFVPIDVVITYFLWSLAKATDSYIRADISKRKVQCILFTCFVS